MPNFLCLDLDKLECKVLKIRQEIDFLDRKKCINFSSPMTSPLRGLSPATVKGKKPLLMMDILLSKLFPFFFLAKDS